MARHPLEAKRRAFLTAPVPRLVMRTDGALHTVQWPLQCHRFEAQGVVSSINAAKQARQLVALSTPWVRGVAGIAARSPGRRRLLLLEPRALEQAVRVE